MNDLITKIQKSHFKEWPYLLILPLAVGLLVSKKLNLARKRDSAHVQISDKAIDDITKDSEGTMKSFRKNFNL